MNKRVIALGILAVALPVFVGAQSMEQKNQSSSQTSGTMAQMTSHYQKMSTLMDKLMHSMSVMESENNPEALAQELSDHGALLKQMQDEMTQHGKIMHDMSTMNNCMSGNDSQQTTK